MDEDRHDYEKLVDTAIIGLVLRADADCEDQDENGELQTEKYIKRICHKYA